MIRVLRLHRPTMMTGDFVEKLFCKLHGPLALEHLPDWGNFLKSLSMLDEQLLHFSVFFGDEEMASLFIDLHRLLRHEFPNRGLQATATNILQGMGQTYTDAPR